MKEQNGENLRELFERFFEPEQAQKAAEDICEGEKILRENPAPEPSDEIIAKIRSEIAVRLHRRQTGAFRKIAYRVTVAAAAVIILASIGIKLFEKEPELKKQSAIADKDVSIIPVAIWDSQDITTDDIKLAVFTAEVDEIENELVALQWKENGGNSEAILDELEMELLEMDTDFWKG